MHRRRTQQTGRSRFWLRAAGVAAVAALAGSMLGVLTAANSVPSSNAGESTAALSAQDLAPSQCAGMGLTNIVTGTGGTVTGTAANDLILGTTGSETIRGGGGNDCMIGGSRGATRDTFQGGAGGDVCIGDGTRRDSYTSCATIVNR